MQALTVLAIGGCRGGFVAALRAHNATGPIIQLHVAGTIYRLQCVDEGSGDSRVAAPIRRLGFG